MTSDQFEAYMKKDDSAEEGDEDWQPHSQRQPVVSSATALRRSKRPRKQCKHYMPTFADDPDRPRKNKRCKITLLRKKIII